MTKEEIKQLKQRRLDVNENYVRAFCLKHNLELPFDTYWIGGRDDTVQIEDYFIDRWTLIYAVENDTPEEEFFKWYDYDLMVHELGMPKRINYESWCKGAPKPYTEDDFDKVRELQEEVRRAKDALEKCINEINKKDF